MTDPSKPLSLFDGYGVEIESMIVDSKSLDVRSLSDEVLKSAAGDYVSEVELDGFCWSNELVLHVIEVKTNGPRRTLDGLGGEFLTQFQTINRLLAQHGAQLMPTAMHPWMNPDTDTRLWPHENNEIYDAYNRIFNCHGHGWSNLQSVHLNLPFATEEEFVRLHAAIRLVLPLIPALAASSPLADGHPTGFLDYRLEVYRKNQKLVPSVTGLVIPESVRSIEEYRTEILETMYRDISPYDPEGILQEEWLNSRGAIARFERNTIEIRVIDTQESPLMDLAVAQAVVSVIKALVEERWCSIKDQLSCPTEPLSELLKKTIRQGDSCLIDDRQILKLFDTTQQQPIEARHLWKRLLEDLGAPVEDGPLSILFKEGCLARRILAVLKTNPVHQRIAQVYRHLCDCLEKGKTFTMSFTGSL